MRGAAFCRKIKEVESAFLFFTATGGISPVHPLSVPLRCSGSLRGVTPTTADQIWLNKTPFACLLKPASTPSHNYYSIPGKATRSAIFGKKVSRLPLSRWTRPAARPATHTLAPNHIHQPLTDFSPILSPMRICPSRSEHSSSPSKQDPCDLMVRQVCLLRDDERRSGSTN